MLFTLLGKLREVDDATKVFSFFYAGALIKGWELVNVLSLLPKSDPTQTHSFRKLIYPIKCRPGRFYPPRSSSSPLVLGSWSDFEIIASITLPPPPSQTNNKPLHALRACGRVNPFPADTTSSSHLHLLGLRHARVKAGDQGKDRLRLTVEVRSPGRHL